MSPEEFIQGPDVKTLCTVYASEAEDCLFLAKELAAANLQLQMADIPGEFVRSGCRRRYPSYCCDNCARSISLRLGRLHVIKRFKPISCWRILRKSQRIFDLLGRYLCRIKTVCDIRRSCSLEPLPRSWDEKLGSTQAGHVTWPMAMSLDIHLSSSLMQQLGS